MGYGIFDMGQKPWTQTADLSMDALRLAGTMAAARDKKINQTSTTHSETKTSGGRGGIGGVLGSVVGGIAGSFIAPGVGTALGSMIGGGLGGAIDGGGTGALQGGLALGWPTAVPASGLIFPTGATDNIKKSVWGSGILETMVPLAIPVPVPL